MKPIEIHRYRVDAIKRKYKLTCKTGKQLDIRWYNVGSGPMKKGWGLFEVSNDTP